VRLDWSDLPANLRSAIEERLGGRVVEAVTQRGGFSPGLAARLKTANGTRFFVKAVSEQANPDTPGMHRREAEVVAALPVEAAVPRLHWTYDEGGWVAVCFDDVEGKTPTLPWRGDELDLVITALARLHEVLTPSPISSSTAGHAFATLIRGFDELRKLNASTLPPWVVRNIDRLAELEADAPNLVSGTTLLNFDVRADNILIAGSKVYFVDWPHARIGAPFVEWLGLAPSVAMQGGPKPAELLRAFPLGQTTNRAIDAVLASSVGYFVAHSRRTPPPGIPTVRAFQAAQGDIALAWLRERTGWP
jgi:hypothetical protein